MRECLIVVGVAVLAIGLRSSRSAMPRKLGALMFLAASFLLVAFWTDCWWCGVFGVIPWFLLPWVELLTRVRRMRLPLKNRLAHGCTPDPAFFPNAQEAASGMEEAGFEHIDDCGWNWSGMRQHFRIFWHPEECAEATVCLCEQGEVAFAFIAVTSRDRGGNIYRTTNYPFSPTLRCPPRVRWNHVPCERNIFGEILEDHRKFLRQMKVSQESLRMPDPERVETMIEEEMQEQVEHNLEAGIIEPSADEHFKYSVRGLFFLWGQFVKDMIRLC